MSMRYHMNRPRGNLLPRAKTEGNTNPCVHYFVDPIKLKETGELIPMTEPEEFKSDYNPFAHDWDHSEEFEGGNEEMAAPKGNKPSKDQLIEESRVMTLKEIAIAHSVSVPSASQWFKSYGLSYQELKAEFRNLSGGALMETQEQKPPETIEEKPAETQVTKESDASNPEKQPEEFRPTQEELEQFFTDTPAESQAKLNTLAINGNPDPDEKMWQTIEFNLRAIKLLKHERAEKEFQDRLLKLLEI